MGETNGDDHLTKSLGQYMKRKKIRMLLDNGMKRSTALTCFFKVRFLPLTSRF